MNLNFLKQHEFSYDFFAKISNRVEVVMIGGWCAILLQLYHPQIAAAIRDHSQFRDAPFKRWLRTILFLEITLNGSSREKGNLTDWLNRMHKPVHGTLQAEGAVANLPPETSYGFTEDLQLWVVATLAFAFLEFHRVFGTPLEENEKDLICSEFMMIAYRLGVPLERLPLTYAEYEQYFNRMLEQIEVSSTTQQMVTALFQGGVMFQGAVMGNTRMFQLLNRGAVLLGFSLLPQRMREVLGIQLSFSQKLLQAMLCLLVRGLYRMLPQITIQRFLTWLCWTDSSVQPVIKNTLNQIYHTNLASDQALSWFSERTQQSFTVRIGADVEDGAAISITEQIKALLLTVPRHIRQWVDKWRCQQERYWLAMKAGNHRPQHLGIIMDGNRRFAEQQQWVPWTGHYFGVNKLRDVVIWAFKADIKALTVWAFSNDNFNRSSEEVEHLFSLMEEEFRSLQYSALVHTWQIQINVIGERDRLPLPLLAVIKAVEDSTAGYSQFSLQIAMPYSGRAEILSAVRASLNEVVPSELPRQIANLEEEAITRNTYLSRLGLPPIDYILRTSNEWRTSGFMLWDSAYSELYFCQELWPKFSQIEFLKSVRSFCQRQRRFGV
jgi:tritrans,polycis-undecaprenyl-diphosphate synthase [geranylgeranyl-diphosphate specific]